MTRMNKTKIMKPRDKSKILDFWGRKGEMFTEYLHLELIVDKHSELYVSLFRTRLNSRSFYDKIIVSQGGVPELSSTEYLTPL